jgi:hypothetical protein
VGDDAPGHVIGGRRLGRGRDGRVRLRLPARERELLRELAAEHAARLGDDADAPDFARLFPPAYAEAPEDEREYRALMHAELLGDKQESVRVFATSLESDALTDDELDAWLRVLNDLRLVLGTRLDVSETTFADGLDPRDPDAPELALYSYLSWLQEQAVEVAAAGLPDRAP